MIEAVDICPPFGLKGPITIGFDPGTFSVLVGPNGAGKSTLLRTMAGVLLPESGTIKACGESIEDVSTREQGKRLTLLSQTENPLKGFTVRQSVALGRYPHRSPWRRESAADREAIQVALVATDLLHLSDRDVSNLSGGEFQRVRIARALAQDAKILLLDEPTASLDLGHATQCLKLIIEIVKDRQLTVVAALHDLNLAALFADRVVVINQGQIQFDGLPEEALTAHRLSPIYDTRLHCVDHPVSQRPQLLVQGPDEISKETP